MEQRVVPQVVGCRWRRESVARRRRRADREHRSVHEALGADACISAGSVADGDIDAIAEEIGMDVASLDADLEIGAIVREPVQPGRTPFRGKQTERTWGRRKVW